MKEKNKFVLILGSNIGDRDSYLTRAQESLKLAGIKIIKTTKSVSTVPALVHQQDFFKNQGLFIGTDNSPEKLLELIKNIEKKLGRVFVQRYGPRCIDIDIAWWNRGGFKSEKLNNVLSYNEFVNAPPTLKQALRTQLSEKHCF